MCFGCTVVGSAGGPAKCKLVKEQFGFDHCVDYKACESAKDLAKALRRAAPGGIDMYFEKRGWYAFRSRNAMPPSERTGGYLWGHFRLQQGQNVSE